MSESICPACGGSGWIQIRTRGMCGIDCDFEEVEKAPCEICGVGLELEGQAAHD